MVKSRVLCGNTRKESPIASSPELPTLCVIQTHGEPGGPPREPAGHDPSGFRAVNAFSQAVPGAPQPKT